MFRTLVTGASGFIGSHLVRQLCQEGDDVIAVGRSQPAGWQTWVESSPGTFRFISLDLQDPGLAKRHLPQIDRVFHLAAATATRSEAESRRLNVDVTRRLAESCTRQPSSPVFVFVSSLAAAGPREQASVETDACHPVSVYGRTKWEAEQALTSLASGLPITIVRPPCVFGRDDQNLLALVKTVAAGWNLVLSRTSRYSYIAVEDLLVGLLAACQRGRRVVGTNHSDSPLHPGLYYLSDPVPVTFPELAEMIAAALGRRSVRHVRLPTPLGWSMGAAGEAFLRVTGKKTFLNLDKIREGVAGSWICDATRAKTELDFSPATDLAARIGQTVRDYQSDGKI